MNGRAYEAVVAAPAGEEGYRGCHCMGQYVVECIQKGEAYEPENALVSFCLNPFVREKSLGI